MSRNEETEHRRQQKGAAGDQLATVTDHPAEKAGDDRSDQRQKYDCDGQRSTVIAARGRPLRAVPGVTRQSRQLPPWPVGVDAESSRA